MKKTLNLLLIMLLALVSLTITSCGDKTPTEEGGGQTQVRKTVIKYCHWGFGTEEDNNLIRRRVEAFNKQSSTIRVEIVIPADGTSYDDFLTTMAAAGELPDVFMVNSVPTAVINQQALDLTTIATNDSEWMNIPSSLRDSITYNGHIYAVPAGQYYMGLFANYDLINDYLKGGEDAEEKFATGEFTTEEWLDIVKAMKNIGHTDGTSTIGMNAVGDMINWLPSSLDATGETQHFVWNGRSFDFRSDLMIEALRTIAELGDKNSQYVFDSIPLTIGEGDEQEDYRSVLFGDSSAATVFINGQMGFIQEGSWADTFDNVDFNYSFISYPDAKVIAATDYLCISKATKNQEAAFEVAKYMTYGEKGLKDMFDIIASNPEANLSLTGIPLNTDHELSNRWFSFIKMNGLQETFDKVASGDIQVIVEGNKSTPGFLKARYYFQTGISFETVRGGALLSIGDFIWDVCGGDISINDYITTMTEELANKINDEVRKDFEAMGLTY